MHFTKLDFANCTKYSEVANNATIKAAFKSLVRENTIENKTWRKKGKGKYCYELWNSITYYE